MSKLGVESLCDSDVSFLLFRIRQELSDIPPESRRRALQHVEHELHLHFGRSRLLGVSRSLVSDTVRTAPKDSALAQRAIDRICTEIVSAVERALCGERGEVVIDLRH
ncbi:hypothetical protein DEH84_00135 [Aquabacterium olei]|uniref:Uncharacterized protein n=1 Tax=Aquabacterium olei TaxID=1296669 RepID=A0A2U8FM52_9BURK|nr:hypothetical protein DEH84_00135 [Aquabacterium olei]